MRSTDAALPPPASRLRGGFILPTTLLVMTLLTVMLTAAFIMASAEFRASDNSLASSRALSLAQAGMENYFSQQRNLDTSTTYDSLRITFSNGYADVVGRRVRAQTASRLPVWLVRSIGTSTDPRQPGQSQGQRAVAQMAELNNNIIPARAALVALNGIQMVGGASQNPINGSNLGFSQAGCVIPGGSAADTVAYTIGPNVATTGSISMAATATGYSRSSGSFITDGFVAGKNIIASGFSIAANNGLSTITAVTAGALTVSKSPPTQAGGNSSGRTISVTPGGYLGGSPYPSPNREGPLASISAVYDSTHIDWQRVLNGDFSPDYVNTWPPICTGTCTYNSYYWTGNVTLPTGQRRAMLVATGDVTVSDGTHWDGITVAGGALKPVSSNYVIHAMAITGIGCGIGACPATQDSIQRGGSNAIEWDWCYTHAAIGGLNGLVPLKNTWIDTWSLY